MKREIFDRVIALCSKPGFLSRESKLHKITNTDDFESHCFIVRDDEVKEFSEKLAFLKTSGGYKLCREAGKSVLNLLFSPPVSTYLTVNYNKIKDKISISEFRTGWRYAPKKNIFYPFTASTPLLCYGKYLYIFNGFKKPRICTTEMLYQLNEKSFQDIQKTLLDIDFIPTITATSKHIHGAKDDWDIIYRLTGIHIPKALRIFTPVDVHKLVAVMSNPGELNTLCQVLSKTEDHMEVHSDPPSLGRVWEYGNSKHNLWGFLSSYMITVVTRNGVEQRHSDNSYLIRDYIDDLYALKKKSFTLKMKSVTRLKDEHRKMSILRRSLKMKPIKVHHEYKLVEEKLKEKLDIVQDLEMITNKKRLLQEGIEQQHCVASYGNRINQGFCTIISLIYNEKRYTCEINRINTNHFMGSIGYSMNQCRGIQNVDAPVELKTAIKTILNDIVGSANIVV